MDWGAYQRRGGCSEVTYQLCSILRTLGLSVWNGPRAGRSLRDQIVFFLLRTALKDRPKGPPTANCQLPSTANRHQLPTTNRHQPPPTASGDQPPTANHCQPPPTTNHQPPTAANHHQPPPTASCQLPTANRQTPTANRHQPWLSTWSARGFFWENWFRNTFFFPVKERPGPRDHCCRVPHSVTAKGAHGNVIEELWVLAVVALQPVPCGEKGWHSTSVSRGGPACRLVDCSRLQPAAPIGRSPFAALPSDPFSPSTVVPIGLSPVPFLFLAALSVLC